jgi:hypothetical protein
MRLQPLRGTCRKLGIDWHVLAPVDPLPRVHAIGRPARRSCGAAGGTEHFA